MVVSDSAVVGDSDSGDELIPIPSANGPSSAANGPPSAANAIELSLASSLSSATSDMPVAKKPRSSAPKGVWDHFESIPSADGKGPKSAKCIHCKAIIPNARPDRILLKHLRSCAAAKGHIDVETLHSDKLVDLETCFNELGKAKFDSKRTDMLLAAYIVHANLPIAHCESPMLRRLLQSCLPTGATYRTPSRQTLMDTAIPFLDALYRRHVKQSLLLGLHTVSIDGWKTKRGESVYAVMVTNEKGEAHFMSAHNMGTDAATAENLAKIVENVLSQLDMRRVVAIVSDGAPNCARMRELVTKAHPWLVSIHCFTHSLNLLMRDIFRHPMLSSTLSHCYDICAYFNKSNRSAQLLIKSNEDVGNKAGRKLLKVGNTRFGSNLATMRSLYANKPGLQEMARQGHIPRKEAVSSVVCKDTFWARVEAALAIMEPLQKLLTRSESNYYPASACFNDSLDMVHVMVEHVGNHVNVVGDDFLPHCIKAFQKRLKCLNGDLYFPLAASLEPDQRSLPWTSGGIQRMSECFAKRLQTINVGKAKT